MELLKSSGKNQFFLKKLQLRYLRLEVFLTFSQCFWVFGTYFLINIFLIKKRVFLIEVTYIFKKIKKTRVTKVLPLFYSCFTYHEFHRSIPGRFHVLMISQSLHWIFIIWKKNYCTYFVNFRACSFNLENMITSSKFPA